jgi:hypothetical protein
LDDGPWHIGIEIIVADPIGGQSQVLEEGQGRNQVENLRVWKSVGKDAEIF